ncbi:MAG: hypothetical protein JWO30_4664 [Fibrobacteres bacterium]|nr:hypothetical protein [Fibrobacterota bacterium]
MNSITKGFFRLNWTLTFLSSYQPESLGGQAVIEGVLMRSPRRLAVAVRAPDGSIVVDNQEFLSYSRRHKLLGLPIIRGAASLIESLAIGIKALNFSMSVQEKAQPDAPVKPKAGKADGLWVALSLLSSLALALCLFQLLPYFVASHIVGGTKSDPANPVLFNLTAGGVRMSLLLGYMWGISYLRDIGRVFQYHGAEHKSIFVHERRGPLDVASARLQSRFHPRCGTSFILIVAMVCILFFSALDGALWQWFHFTYPSALARFALHLPFVPIVAGLSFEVLKLTARFQDSIWVRPFVLPGLWLQKITTQEPDEKQLEVAIASIRAALA